MFEISSFGPKRRLLLLGCGFFSGNSAAMPEKTFRPETKSILLELENEI